MLQILNIKRLFTAKSKNIDLNCGSGKTNLLFILSLLQRIITCAGENPVLTIEGGQIQGVHSELQVFMCIVEYLLQLPLSGI
jgi:hypothetical protein